MKFLAINSLLTTCLVYACFVVLPDTARAVENFESLKVLEMVLPNYPMKMTFQGVYEGTARVMIRVDESGKLIDVFQESYTHPEFGGLADEYVRLWTFQPAKLNGEPVASIKPVDFNFDDRRGVYSLGIMETVASGYNLGRFAKSKQVCSVKDLDHGLQPLEMRQPPFPKDFYETDIEGLATVIFYIDESGKTRMPYLTEQSHPSFGQAALLAVEHWRFKPPLLKGEPVSVLVRQVFTFSETARK